MIHLNVQRGPKEPALLAVDETSTGPAVATPPTVVSLTRGAQPAANEDEAATADPVRNPLWIIAMGMACLFGAMAAIMALG